MKQLKLATSALMALLLVACASMTTPETHQERLLVATEQAVSVVQTAERLHNLDVLTDEQFEDVLDRADEAKAALEDARALLRQGNVDDAEGRLELADSILKRLKTRLEAQQNE